MENNSNKDIAVFTFSRGSQMNDNIQNTESYQFVQRILKNMMSRIRCSQNWFVRFNGRCFMFYRRSN
jgi:hypothetical protein